MNNLNKDVRKRHVPDILRNLNVKDVNEKGYNKPKVDDVMEKKLLNISPEETPREEKPDFTPKDEERRKSRKIKKVLGYAGWALCFPLMLTALAIRDKPSNDEPDEWKDDPCLPWWYDVDFKYAGDDDDSL